MALRRSANENGNFIDHTKQTPMRLFKDRNCERSNIAAEVEQTIPRNEAWGSFWFRIFELFVTSPTVKRTTPVPPNAPIKPRKSFFKVGLKPKKLRFTDKEKDEIDGENRSQKSADYSIKVLDHKEAFSKKKGELKEKSSRENLSAMLRNIRLETDDKENKQYENERYERKVKDGRYSVKERGKYRNNCTQSLKLNCNTKDKFVHFRI
ncbi:uncharacterized protein LOC126850971 [Cataglyphis hispanica]|uniref:uncharacterized protein LOC126850971 n=1 Tax=Cataglyphis hispanica TaxID=1086592 RepID=UPI002180789D|nr:uncharacterized protein LOC126850971 [Cataglyphis hispanica]